MGDFKLIEEAESTFAQDESDIDEEQIKLYDEHFWCKDKDTPVGFTFKSKKQDFVKACENIKSYFQKVQKGSQKQMDNLAFRILDSRSKENGPEMDIEIIKNKNRGNAVLKFYGPNIKSGECTLMITKSKKHEVKYVKLLAIDVIKIMIDKFISGEGWGLIFKKNTTQQFICSPCNKSFVCEKNMNTHMEKFHTGKEYSCEKCKYVAKDEKQFKEHTGNHTYRKNNCSISDYKLKNEKKMKKPNKRNDSKTCQYNIEDKNKTCGSCEIEVKQSDNLKEHSSSVPMTEEELIMEEPVEMEIDEPILYENTVTEKEKEDLERKKRSEMQDKKIIENKRKRDEEEQRTKVEREEAERRKIQEEKEKKEEEKLERKKRKSSVKQQKKRVKKRMSKYPPNVTELPLNVKHLVDEGDLQFLVPPDGACAPNAGAAHFFKDPKFGPKFRMIMNNFIADKWFYYQQKISFPYTRKIGVKGDFVRFEIGEEQKFRQFLRTKRAAYLWSDNEDLHVMSNLYQIQIMVITTKGEQDSHPTVTWIGPDPELDDHKLLPAGVVPDMKLLHYDELHFNLIISQNSDLAKIGTLSQYLDEEEKMLIDDGKEDVENVTIEEETHAEAYKKSQIVIDNLKRKIVTLEKDIKEKSNELKDAIDIIEHAHEFQSVKNKRNGSTNKENQNEGDNFLCEECNSKFKTQILLTKHISLYHAKGKDLKCSDCSLKGSNVSILNTHLTNSHEKQNILKELRETQKSKNNIEKEYQMCEQELRMKTEELEKYKIENKDLRTIVELRKLLIEKEPNLKESEEKEQVACEVKQVETPEDIEVNLTEKDDEFNCMDCDFQTTSETYLKKHIKLKHILNCKICQKEFKDKVSLMQHRKKEHKSLVAPCRKYAVKMCPYIEETCWWNHNEKGPEPEKTQCFICGETFKSKGELMRHRKKEHLSIVRQCDRLREGKCGFQDEFCWFRHDNKDQIHNKTSEDMDIGSENEDSKDSELVFHKAKGKLKPPLKNNL